VKFDQAKFNRQQSMRRFYFAKFCAERKYQVAPSGLTWAEVFHKKEGLTLEQFKEKVDAFKRSSKQSKGS
jgi:hypothetical protein